ncbi:MAG: hypothetical protein RLZZ470_1641, partial [Pseudomonadota bacterium]
MKRTFARLATLPLLLCCTCSMAGDKHAAHSHGLGNVELVVQGGTVKASFEIPMDSLLGFEHLPRTPAQKKALADLQT